MTSRSFLAHNRQHPKHAPVYASTWECLQNFIQLIESDSRTSLDGETLSRHYGDVFTICTSPYHNSTTTFTKDSAGRIHTLPTKDNGAQWCYTEYQYLISGYLHDHVFAKLKAIKETNYTPEAFLTQYIKSWNNFKSLLASCSLVFRYLDEWYLKSGQYTLERRSYEMWYQELYDLEHPDQFIQASVNGTSHIEERYIPSLTPARANFFCAMTDLKRREISSKSPISSQESKTISPDGDKNLRLNHVVYPSNSLVKHIAINAFLSLLSQERRVVGGNSILDLPSHDNVMSDELVVTTTTTTTTTTPITTTTTTTTIDESKLMSDDVNNALINNTHNNIDNIVQLLRQFTDSLIELGLKSSYDTHSTDKNHEFSFYKELEMGYLKNLKFFYQSEYKFSELSFSDYALKLSDLFTLERKRATACMRASSIPQLDKTLHDIAVQNTLEPLLSKQGAMEFYTAANNLSISQKLFDFVAPYGDTLRTFTRRFQEYVQQQGSKLTTDFVSKKKQIAELRKVQPQQPIPRLDPVDLVHNIIALDAHFRNFVVHCCKSHPSMITALRQASESYINVHENIISQILAQYLHSLLSARTAKAQSTLSTSLSEQIHNVAQIFKYIRNKDIFEHEYQRLLCQRILSGDSISQQQEKDALLALTKESGAEFSKKAGSIEQDLETSKQHTFKFQQKSVDFLLKHGLDVQFNICTSNSGWVLPQSQYAVRYTFNDGLQQQKTNLQSINTYTKLPKAMQEVWAQFGQYYTSQYERRYLEFRLDDGICEVTYIPDINNPQNTKILVVTPIMAIILLHLSKQPKFVLWKDLVQDLSIDPRLLADHLLPLCLPLDQPTKCIVRKSTGIPTFKDDDKLILSKQFDSNSIKHFIRYERRQTVKDVEKRDQELEKMRMFQCKAVLVRSMKMRKECQYQELINEAIKQLASRFTPSSAMLKDAIEKLIEDDNILERDSNDRNLIVYLA